MARKTTALTNTEVSQAKPKEKEYNLSDGEGLMLRVKPNGSKLWLFNYSRPFTKKRANISFGIYPDLSLANARKLRTEARELLAQDVDPKEHRDHVTLQNEKASNNTFKQVALLHHEVKKTTLNAEHAKKVWRSIELHLLPSLGNIPIHKLTAPEVIKTLKPLSAKSLETVKRLCQRINEVMVYAVNAGLINHNSLAGISRSFVTPTKQHYPTVLPDQLPQLMKALSMAGIKLTTRYLIEWQLHTMVRPSEAAGARWDEIDLEAALWVIPAERMKKKKPHTVPLTSQALALLDGVKPLSGKSEYIFTSDKDYRKPANSSTANMALKRMGYHGILVAHGLRALASTTLNEEGFNHDVIESCLAHVDKNETRAAYNRAEYIERRKKVMCWWSERIEKAATGNMSLATSKQGLKVVNG